MGYNQGMDSDYDAVGEYGGDYGKTAYVLELYGGLESGIEHGHEMCFRNAFVLHRREVK